MKFPALSRHFRAVIGFCVVGSLILMLRAADTNAAAKEPLAQALEGVWGLVGEAGNVRASPQPGGPLKFRQNGHWTYTRADPGTGVDKQHFGGTYRVRGNDYIETIDYSTDADDPELKKSLRFTVKVAGDTMTQTGVGNPYNEVWKRVR